PARATIDESSRRHAAASAGDHEYIRADATSATLRPLLADDGPGLRQLGARTVGRRRDREQLAVDRARLVPVTGQLGGPAEAVQGPEPIRGDGERRLVLGDRLGRLAHVEQHVAEQLAGES